MAMKLVFSLNFSTNKKKKKSKDEGKHFLKLFVVRGSLNQHEEMSVCRGKEEGMLDPVVDEKEC